MEEQSFEGEAVGVPSSTVMIPSLNKEGKSWNALGENFVPQNP
jgi:hypothetical protein